VHDWDMKATRLILPAAIGAAIAGCAVARSERRASMHEHDWEDQAVPYPGRRYRSVRQLLHHQWELLGMLDTLFRIYVLRALDPAFREQVMIVTALSNGCPA
jgi:hypothetical protein